VPPFYAVKIFPGDFSTLAGLRVDEHARVLNSAHEPIVGLYAAGNDALSLFGGMSPAGGATLGPAMTLGYTAGLHMSGGRSRAHVSPRRQPVLNTD
jgi:predicted oxidoreductase